jgi:Tfp pilus assembly protein PilO
VKKGPNPKMFLLLAVGALVVGGGLTFMAWNNLSGATSNLHKLQAEVKDAKTLDKLLAESNASLQECSLKLQHLELSVPDFAYIPTLLADLEKTGKASGIDVTGVRPMPKPVTAKKDDGGESAPKRKAYEEMDIEVKGHGSYHAVITFLQAMSKFPKIVAARTVDLAPKASLGQGPTTLDVTISLRAYVFASPQPPKGVTAMKEGSRHEG